MKSTDKKIVFGKIRKLIEISGELKNGKSFQITRLTILKKLCEDPDDAGHFALYLARCAQNKMENMKSEGHKHIKENDWEYHKKLVGEAVSKMSNYLDKPAGNMEPELESELESKSELRNLLEKLKRIQGEVKKGAWGTPIRSIINWNALIVEDAVQCILDRNNSSYWGYDIARDYAEKYNPRYGTSLVPESAGRVDDIANFWSNYYFGKNIGEEMEK